MGLTIEDERCQGHGRCALANPELFEVDDDGRGHVIVDQPAPGQLPDVQRAIATCPEHAVVYS